MSPKRFFSKRGLSDHMKIHRTGLNAVPIPAAVNQGENTTEIVEEVMAIETVANVEEIEPDGFFRVPIEGLVGDAGDIFVSFVQLE